MYKEKVKKEIKILLIAFIFNTIMRGLNLLWAIIHIILVYRGILEKSADLTTIGILAAAKFGFTLTCMIDLTRKQSLLDSFDNLYDGVLKNLRDTLIGGLILPAIVIICIIVAAIFDLSMQPLLSLGYAIGYTSIGGLSFLVAYLMTLVAYTNIKYYKKIEQSGYENEEAYHNAVAEERKKYIENQEKMYIETKKQTEERKVKDQSKKLLDDIGIKFFVKYYAKLRDWSTPDIIDEIEENYSEESKIKRIKSAKKLFESNLQITALEIIANESGKLTDENTKEKASMLLQQETQQ